MSSYKKINEIVKIKTNFKNEEVNDAINSAKKTFSEYIKKYPDQDVFNENVNIDDEIADLSVVLLSAADVFGDFEEEIEIRTILEMIWSSDSETEEEEEGC